MEEKINLKLRIWRQDNPNTGGRLVHYEVDDISIHMSFLEMLDILNENLILKGERPFEFDSDCREGICGTCGLVVNGIAHGKKKSIAICQMHMRHFKDGQTVTIEPFRARAFPLVRDLVVDRSAFDRVIVSGGYISVNTGSAPEANSILVPKDKAENAMDSAACIGCGACVAACPNASASLFVSAKISQFAYLPQGQVERQARVMSMLKQMDSEGFGDCSNHGECEAVCPTGAICCPYEIVIEEHYEES